LIGDKRPIEPGGAAFLLTSPPAQDLIFPLGAAEIELRSGQPYVVARFAPVVDPTTAFAVGHYLAQQGLDLMSILGTLDAVIRDAEDEHLIWWAEKAGIVVRAVSTTLLRFVVGPIKVIVRDNEGNEVPPKSVQPRHHIGFRFFRLAQATDDFFEAYRNMYLAFESLVSSHYPKLDNEREIDWLRRALKSASAALRLDGLRVSPTGDLVDSIVDSILAVVYKDARLPLFHAKEGRHYFAPHDSSSDREAVSRALALLTQIVMRMAEAWFDARRTGGGVFFGWVYENARKMLAESSAYASSYDGPFDASERDLSHLRFQTAAKLQTRLAPELQRGREPAVLSVASGAELSQVNPVRRVELASGAGPFIAHILEAPLELDGISRFEDLMHIRAMNLNQPRSLFHK